MDINFTSASEKDIATIIRLAHKIWHEHYPAIITVEQIDYMLDTRYSAAAIAQQMQGSERYFLASLNEQPVGYASIEWKGQYYYLHKFYLDVAKHGTGIGEAFFNFLLQHTDTSKTIKLQVNRQNYKAINFYFKMGFVIEQVGDFHIGKEYYMNDFVMIRK